MPPEELTAPLPELVVVADPAAGLQAGTADPSTPGAPDAPTAAPGVDTGTLASILQSAGAELLALFDAPQADEAQAAEQQGNVLPDLSVFFTVSAPEEGVEELAAQLRAQDAVLGAFVAPPVALPETATPATPTPDFSTRQGYLGAAPDGIDAFSAWGTAGGDGTGVRIVDVEGGWCLTHEDLAQNSGGLIAGTPFAALSWRNHGTAVMGAIGGDAGGVGITGIAPNAVLSAISHGTIGSAQAIRLAAKQLHAGDLLLLEMHRPGPRHAFTLRDDQLGYIAVEWWPHNFAAIAFAVAQGVVVVEAAGNGAEDLDDAIYDTPATGFPGTWVNPFRRHLADCGAIIVGAGAPPPSTHGRDHGPDRSRLDFSNFGRSVDAQGWGREVTTTGYGDLQSGDEAHLYTDTFSGTSSASPIVTGALACAQGAVLAAGKTPVVPWRARQLVRAFGSPQQDAPTRPATERIGRRPDLAVLLPRAVNPPAPSVTKVADENWGPAWSHVTSFVLDGQPRVLGYRTADYTDADGATQPGGGAWIATLDPGGATAATIWQSSWTTGWTAMAAVDLGGAAHLISYKAGVDSDNAAIDRIAADGQGTVSTYTGSWQADWRILAPLRVAGAALLLCYGIGGGTFTIDPLLDDGSGFGPTLATGEGWAADWTHLVGHELAEETLLFGFKSGLGGVALNDVDAAGTVSMRFGEQWQPTWSHFASIVLGGEVHQASYRASDGTLMLDRLLPGGEGVDTTGTYDLGAGWTAVVPFDVGRGPQLLTYDEVSGAAAYWTIAYP